MANIFHAIHQAGRQRQLRDIGALRTFNLIVAAVHVALLYMFLQIDMSRPVTILSIETSTAPDRAPTTTADTLLSLDIFTVIASYLGIAIIAHVFVATIGWRWYRDFLKQHRNPFRWIEYALSCSLMLVALALGVGMADYAILVAIFGMSFVMNLSGMVFENIAHKSGTTYWSPFVLGCIVGTVPWILLLTHIYSSAGSMQLDFALAVSWTVLIIYLLFPLNMFLSAKRLGPWQSYVTTEMIYISLSLFAKALLAGLLYFNLV